MPRPADPVLVLRPPLWVRVYVVLFVLATAGGLAGGIVQGGSAWPRGAILVAAAVVGWRTAGIAVLADRDELWVRNAVTSRTVRRAEITGFSVDGWNRPGNRTVFAEGLGVRHPLEVTSELIVVPGWRRRLDTKIDELEAWRTRL